MSETFMLLPGRTPAESRVVRLPHDLDEREAYRRVAGFLRALKETDPEHAAEDALEALAEHGFSPVELVVGPALA